MIVYIAIADPGIAPDANRDIIWARGTTESACRRDIRHEERVTGDPIAPWVRIIKARVAQTRIRDVDGGTSWSRA